MKLDFNAELKEIKTEFRTSLETMHLNSINFNAEIEKRLAQLQYENASLKKNLQTASENLKNVSSKIETIGQSCMQ